MGKGKRGKWKQRKKLERLTHVGPPDVVLGLPDWHREQGPEEGLSRDVLPGAVPCDVELSFCFLKGVRSFFFGLFEFFFVFGFSFFLFVGKKTQKNSPGDLVGAFVGNQPVVMVQIHLFVLREIGGGGGEEEERTR